MYQHIIKNKTHIFKFSDIITDDNHKQFTHELFNLFVKPFNVIFDLLNVSSVDMSIIYNQSTFMSDNEKYAKKFITKSCILINNNWQMKLLNILFYFKPPVSPYIVSDSYETCFHFIKN